jgi:alpha-L-arabinofuranosidase
MKSAAMIIVWALGCILAFGKVDALGQAPEAPSQGGPPPGSLNVDGTSPGPKIGPLFYGLMTEEINHAYDGGLYAELIQNRIFQDNDQPVCWSVVGSGKIAIDETNPVNTGALKRSLRLDATGNGAGIANSGFWGIPVWPGTKYHAAFYARATDGATGPLTVEIQSNDGKTTFASSTVALISTEWKKYEVDLTTGQVPISTANRFVISTAGKGSVWFSLVSLFPPTYHNRPNGNRIDISEKLAALHPSFLRFPGGNFLEGNTIATRFDWKKTIGPLENRPGHVGCWGSPTPYRASDGLGLLEFLGWCEDLKMKPILAVYAGYSLRGEHVEPGPALEPYVEEALQEIEYCTGDASTTWGKRRVEDGHAEPFDLHYIEIGNEDMFDKSGTYDGRFTQIFNAIKRKYPKLECIATSRVVHSCKPDLYDDHAYPDPQGMLHMTQKYDKYDSDQPKVFFGEWATQDGSPTPTMLAALGDAAWLTGLQRDCDTVLMNCYAPLLTNVNPNGWQWPTNLIGYDAATSFGSPSYYAQAMFSSAWGDTVLPATVVAQKVELPPAPAPHGGVGLGTWHTAAEYKDLKVTQEGKTLFTSDFATGLAGWKPAGGKWEVGGSVLAQTDTSRECRITTGDPAWQDYTLSVKARKTGGDEGFLVLFHAADRRHFGYFNVGGWGNTKSAIQITNGGSAMITGETSPFTIESGIWYDIRVEVKGRDIKCFVNDKLIVQAIDEPMPPAQTLFAAASRIDSTGEVILKVVNVVGTAQQIEINLQGVGSIGKQATVEVLQGDPQVQNTVDAPTAIAPTQQKIENAGNRFTHVFPADSVSVIRLQRTAQ